MGIYNVKVLEVESKTALSDSGRIAKMLKVTCVNTTIIDSDCAIMEMYNKSCKKADTLVMERADNYFGVDIPHPSSRTGARKLLDRKIEITYISNVYTNVRYAGNMNNIKLKG